MKRAMKIWALVGPRDGKEGEKIHALGTTRADCLVQFYIGIQPDDHWFDHFRKDLRPKGFRFVRATATIGEANE